MRNRKVDIFSVVQIAIALGDLKENIVFVGGSVINLYTDLPSDIEHGETFDVDLTHIEIVNYANYTKFLDKFANKGFHPNPESKNIYNLLYRGIEIDLIPVEDRPIGPSNRWYKTGFKDLKSVKIQDVEIQIFSAPCFLATKFEAFNNRGKDYRTSHDFEDIIFILANRSIIAEEISESDKSIQQFLKKQCEKILENRYMEEIISMNGLMLS